MHRQKRSPRQERWLHTRISENLEDALKREATRRRLPVSLFVRNVLEGALDLVEDIVAKAAGEPPPRRDARRPASSRAGGGPVSQPDTDPLADVYGWQEIILHRGVECVGCKSVLASGASAYRGLRDSLAQPVFLCAACIRRLRKVERSKKEVRA